MSFENKGGETRWVSPARDRRRKQGSKIEGQYGTGGLPGVSELIIPPCTSVPVQQFELHALTVVNPSNEPVKCKIGMGRCHAMGTAPGNENNAYSGGPLRLVCINTKNQWEMAKSIECESEQAHVTKHL
jgi:hypothetical protein